MLFPQSLNPTLESYANLRNNNICKRCIFRAKKEAAINANLKLESVEDSRKKHKEKITARDLRRAKNNLRILSKE